MCHLSFCGEGRWILHGGERKWASSMATALYSSIIQKGRQDFEIQSEKMWYEWSVQWVAWHTSEPRRGALKSSFVCWLKCLRRPPWSPWSLSSKCRLNTSQNHEPGDWRRECIFELLSSDRSRELVGGHSRRAEFLIWRLISAAAFSFSPPSNHSGLWPYPWQVIRRPSHVAHSGLSSSHFFLRNRHVQQPTRLHRPSAICSFQQTQRCIEWLKCRVRGLNRGTEENGRETLRNAWNRQR